MNHLSNLASSLENIAHTAISPDTSSKAKDMLIDYLAVLLNGSNTNTSKNLSTTLCLGNTELNSEDLAFWLGTTARKIDLDDGHRYAMGHPGVVIHSAIISTALNANREISGSTIIQAIIRGYETYCKLGRTVNPHAYINRGFDATGICGASAAAAVSATIMNLNDAQLKNAISIATSLCGGLNQSAIDGSSQKYLVAGWASKLGLFSSKLASNGFSGPSGIFEGKAGYYNAFSENISTSPLSTTTTSWDILNVYTKKYACVRRIHPTLDALSKIIKDTNTLPKDISEVNVYGGDFLVAASNPTPSDITQAQTSVPFAVAIYLKCGEITEALLEQHLEDTAVLDLAERVKVIRDKELVELAKRDGSLWSAARVHVRTKDCKEYKAFVTYAQGERENPIASSETQLKFHKLTSPTLNEDQRNSLIKQIDNLEDTTDVRPLFGSIVRLAQGNK